MSLGRWPLFPGARLRAESLHQVTFKPHAYPLRKILLFHIIEKKPEA